MLKHEPTGFVVRVHETREQSANRQIARKLIKERLDWAINGESSKVERKHDKTKRNKDRQKRRRLQNDGTKEKINEDDKEDSSDEDAQDKDIK